MTTFLYKYFFLPFFLTFIISYSQITIAQTIGGTKNDFSFSVVESNKNEYFIAGYSKSYSCQAVQNVYVIKIDALNIYTKTINSNSHSAVYNIAKLSDGNFILAGFSNEDFGQHSGEDNPLLMKIDKQKNIIWIKSYYFMSFARGINAKQLSDGNILMIGYSRTQEDRDILLLKTTPDGEEIWHKTFNSQGDDYGYDFVETDNGDIILLCESGGYFSFNQTNLGSVSNSDILLIKVSPDGNEISRSYFGGTGNELARKIVKSPDNDGFYIIGSTQSYGEGNFDILLLKIDNDLNTLWYKTYGSPEIEYGNSIDISKDKTRLYIVGTTTNPNSNKPQMTVFSTTLDGTLNWQHNYSEYEFTYGSAISSTSDNGCIAVANTGKNYHTGYDVLVIKFDANGNQDCLNCFSGNIIVFPTLCHQGEKLNILISNDYHNTSKYSINIFDEIGKKIYVSQETDNNIKINTSNFSKGVYILNLIFDNHFTYTTKFIIY